MFLGKLVSFFIVFFGFLKFFCLMFLSYIFLLSQFFFFDEGNGKFFVDFFYDIEVCRISIDDCDVYNVVENGFFFVYFNLFLEFIVFLFFNFYVVFEFEFFFVDVFDFVYCNGDGVEGEGFVVFFFVVCCELVNVVC